MSSSQSRIPIGRILDPTVRWRIVLHRERVCGKVGLRPLKGNIVKAAWPFLFKGDHRAPPSMSVRVSKNSRT
jgi:hypothetical protein